jgi:hypothetical protein
MSDLGGNRRQGEFLQATDLRKRIMRPMFGAQQVTNSNGRAIVSRRSLSHTAQARRVRITGLIVREINLCVTVGSFSLSGTAIPIYINHVAILNVTRQLSAVGFRKARSDRIVFSTSDVLDDECKRAYDRCGVHHRKKAYILPGETELSCSSNERPRLARPRV